MKLLMTPEQLQLQPNIMATILSKLLSKVSWEPEDLSHAEYQWCFDNGVPLDNAVLYSPVLQQSTLNAYVPTNWPGQPVDEEGVQQRLTYGEYLRITVVEGGFCLQFARGPKTVNNVIQLPLDAQLQIQIGLAGGFLTKAEVDAIKVEVVE